MRCRSRRPRATPKRRRADDRWLRDQNRRLVKLPVVSRWHRVISRVPNHRAIVPAAQLQLKRFGEKAALPAELRPAENVLKTARAVLCAGGRPDEIHGLVRGGQSERDVAPLLRVTGNLVDRLARQLGAEQPYVATGRAELKIRM